MMRELRVWLAALSGFVLTTSQAPGFFLACLQGIRILCFVDGVVDLLIVRHPSFDDFWFR